MSRATQQAEAQTGKNVQYRGKVKTVRDLIGQAADNKGVEIQEERSFREPNPAGTGKRQVLELKLSGGAMEDPYKRFWFKKNLKTEVEQVGAQMEVQRKGRKDDTIVARVYLS